MPVRKTQSSLPHVPEQPRYLPADLYGSFDIQAMPDGGKRYSLPYTLRASVMAFVTKPIIVLTVAGFGSAWAVLLPEHDAGSPLSRTWLHALLVFFLLHGIIALSIALALLVNGQRKITRITIRPYGLILDDAGFFPADHIWSIGYGVTSNEGKPEETFAPHITIQVGTHRITLADGIEAEAGKLFMRLFEEDTRRFWSRHN